MVSTPLGMNHFYEFWINAVRRVNNFFPIKVGWWDHPQRDEEWKQDMLRDIGQVRFNQEFGCKFLGSSDTLIDGDTLERIEFSDPVDNKWGGLLSIYEKPIPNMLYILGVDSAKGTGRDYSVIQVLKVASEHDVTQVATFRYNKADTIDFAQYCISVSQYYNEAYMMVENNGEGGEVANFIWYEYEYDKILNCDRKGLGIRATKKSKLVANLLLKRYLENRWLTLSDKPTVSELSKYIEVKPNVFQAETRMTHDDCVTSLIWALYFLQTEYYDGKNVDTKHVQDQFKITDEDVPIMFVS